ncbi:MAG: sigma-70 family RNA polymerase sigma factor [Clostridia bacterium]|nr:sigma-70 family RNA polymerase sigma factor [Oscillospiraceae bacterium]MBQ7033641.1 sigma-70 family RNA polymerase sigma factor [Clostridia bacterium]
MRQNDVTEKKLTLKNELQEMINRGISRAVQAGAQSARQKETRGCRERVERLLYARSGLEILITSLEEELALYRDDVPPSTMAYEKTGNKVVHLLPSGEALGMTQGREGMEALLARNRLAVKRIDRAVATLSDDPYFDILPLKYTEGLPEEEIAERLCCDPSTIRRNKNRLLERLAIIFFGIDALGV